MQRVLNNTDFALVGITKSPFWFVTPPVIKVESMGLNKETLANYTGFRCSSIRRPLSLFSSFCQHSMKMSLASRVTLMG